MSSGERTVPLSEKQRLTLVMLIKDQEKDIVARSTDPWSLERKQRAWRTITDAFNGLNSGQEPRSTQQLKRSWEHVKRKVKMEESEYRKKLKSCGISPPSPPHFSSSMEMAATMMGSELAVGESVTDTVAIQPVKDVISDTTANHPVKDGVTDSVAVHTVKKELDSIDHISIRDGNNDSMAMHTIKEEVDPILHVSVEFEDDTQQDTVTSWDQSSRSMVVSCPSQSSVSFSSSTTVPLVCSTLAVNSTNSVPILSSSPTSVLIPTPSPTCPFPVPNSSAHCSSELHTLSAHSLPSQSSVSSVRGLKRSSQDKAYAAAQQRQEEHHQLKMQMMKGEQEREEKLSELRMQLMRAELEREEKLSEVKMQMMRAEQEREEKLSELKMSLMREEHQAKMHLQKELIDLVQSSQRKLLKTLENFNGFLESGKEAYRKKSSTYD